MGLYAPQHYVSDNVQNLILDVIDSAIKRIFGADNRHKYDYRPLRPDELSDQMTINSRHYSTTVPANSTDFVRLLGATKEITVPVDSAYIFFGWVVIDNPTTSMGTTAVLRIYKENKLVQECAPYYIAQQDNNAVILWRQFIEVLASQTVDLKIKVATDSADRDFLVYPLGVRIAGVSKLSQN